MNLESLQSNWAIWLALAAILFAVAVLTPKLLKMTSRSKLKRVLENMKAARKELRKSTKSLRKKEKKLQKLLPRGDRVKPRVLKEAKEAVEDGRALAKILQDKVMVAETHVRRIIHDEFPPAQHDRLRDKYLAPEKEDKRPFSF